MSQRHAVVTGLPVSGDTFYAHATRSLCKFCPHHTLQKLNQLKFVQHVRDKIFANLLQLCLCNAIVHAKHLSLVKLLAFG